MEVLALDTDYVATSSWGGLKVWVGPTWSWQQLVVDKLPRDVPDEFLVLCRLDKQP